MPTDSEINPELRELSRLKHQYWTAINRKYDTEFADTDTDDEKRRKLVNAARKRENDEFIRRLRDRLSDANVSKTELGQLSAATVTPTARVLSKSNTAILVIHGIGEQNPYETMDQFGRNLMRYLVHEGGIEDLEISAARYDHNDATEARIRLRTERFGPENGPGLIDIYEYYWAPETEDKISYIQTLSWLIKTTLTPILLLNENIQVLKEESDELLSKGAIFRRELLRILFIYLPLLFVLAALTYLLPKATEFPDAVKSLLSSSVRIAMTVFFAASLILDYVVVRQLWKNALRRIRHQPAIFRAQWVWWTFLISIFLMVIGYAVGHFNKFNPVEPRDYFGPLLHWNVLLVLATLGAARLLQRFLADFVGDVAVYTNADAKAKNFAARKAILAGSVRSITRLLREPNVLSDAGGNNQNYEQVIVAGHSLGSVIAYDTLNELLNKKESRPDQIVSRVPPASQINQSDLDRIRGLITFGSPLDKVHYFFRENVPQQQAIRAQILQFLQSFKKRPSGADYGIYRFTRYSSDGLKKVRWLNAWSKQDPISGALHFYTELTRRHFNYAIPIYAHLSYWEDLRFYEFFAEPLLLGNEAALKTKAMGAAV